jgi:hypothetical protein
LVDIVSVFSFFMLQSMRRVVCLLDAAVAVTDDDDSEDDEEDDDDEGGDTNDARNNNKIGQLVICRANDVISAAYVLLSAIEFSLST